MKKLLFTIAAAASFAAMADDPALGPGDISLVGFEGYTVNSTNVVGYGDNGVLGSNSKWTSTGDDASYIRAYLGTQDEAPESIAAPSGVTFPKTFADANAGAGDKYLALDTNGAELQRNFVIDDQTGDPVPRTITADGIYIDTLVQFTVTEDEAPDVTGAKLAIWLQAENGTTNLMAQGNFWELGDGLVPSSRAYVLSGKTIEPGTWYRLTVKAIPNILGSDSTIPAFLIKVDGTEMQLTTSPFSDDLQTGFEGRYATPEIATAMAANKLVPAIQGEAVAYGTPVALTSVGFQGTGAIDDLVITETDPFYVSPIDFTLTWTAAEVSAVSYVLSADMATTNTLTNGTAAQIPAGTTGTIELIPTFESGYEFDYVDMGGTQLTLTFDVPTASTNAALVAKAAAAYPTYVGSDTTLQGQYNTWKATNGADSLSAYEKQFLLNVAPATTVADDALQIDAITENETAGWDIVVSTTVSGAALSDGSATTYNGYLLVKAANDLTGLESATPVAYPVTAVSGGKVSINVTGGKFMKVVLTTTAPAAE